METPSPTLPEPEKDPAIVPVHMRNELFARYAGALGTFPGGPAEISSWIADLRDENAEGEGQSS